MRINKIPFILLITIALTTSCNEDTLEVKNEKAYNADTFYKDANSYSEASTAMYTPLLFAGAYSRDMHFVGDLLGNDSEKNFPLQGDLLEFPNYTHTSNNATINNMWKFCYKIVARSLVVTDLMEKWETSKPEEIALRQRISGEALFMRSFAHFLLVTYWGDVPLRKSINDLDLFKPRAASEEIWKTIEEDLTNAIGLLPVNYETKDLGRATKGAAIALLGKSHLYQKEYPQAIVQFEQLTKAPFGYGLEANYDDLFIKEKSVNKESIFAVMHGEWQGWGVGHAYYMFGGAEKWGGRATHSGRAIETGFNGNDFDNVKVSNALLNSYKYTDEGGNAYTDPRAANVFYGDVASGGDTEFCDGCKDGSLPYNVSENANGYSWRKYTYYEFEEKHNVPHSNINTQLIRYADVLLMLAECYIETGQTESALPLINQVRERAGAFLYTSLGNKEQATSILRRERQMELAGELHRFPDLVRWGILQETINAEKQAAIGIQPVRAYHTKLPIPQAERDANPQVAAQVSDNWN